MEVQTDVNRCRSPKELWKKRCGTIRSFLEMWFENEGRSRSRWEMVVQRALLCIQFLTLYTPGLFLRKVREGILMLLYRTRRAVRLSTFEGVPSCSETSSIELTRVGGKSCGCSLRQDYRLVFGSSLLKCGMISHCFSSFQVQGNKIELCGQLLYPPCLGKELLELPPSPQPPKTLAPKCRSET